MRHNKICRRVWVTSYRTLHLVCSLLVLAGAGGCGQATVGSVEAQILNRGLNGEPESLSPHHFRSNQSASILRDIGEGLVRYDGAGNLVGGVAESWDISDDGLIYVFELREDVRWSNGEPVVAGDFVLALRELVDPKVASTNANNADSIVNAAEILVGERKSNELGVRADGPNRLEIRLRRKTPYFLQLLAHPSMFPIHKSNASEFGGQKTRYVDVTNGAYNLVEWIVGSQLILSRNAEYWANEETAFDKVIYHILQETSELTRFQAGDLDITQNVPSTMFSMVKKSFPKELRVAPYSGVYYYGFNLSNSLFAEKPALRRALSLAIDRDVLVDKITGRGEQAAFGWVPPGFESYTSQSILESKMTKNAREELAVELYEESGHSLENPLHFELRYNTSDVQQRIALAIKSMWQQVLGVEVTIVNEEFRVLLSNIQAQEITEVFRLSWTGDYNDPQTFLQVFESGSPSNLTGFTSEAYDALMARAGEETDSLIRLSLLEEAEFLMLSEHPAIPLYFYVSKHLVDTRIDGWENNILDIHPSQYLTVR
jgi:ABC-type oligopeptide transport system substrate-binding subunit